MYVCHLSPRLLINRLNDRPANGLKIQVYPLLSQGEQIYRSLCLGSILAALQSPNCPKNPQVGLINFKVCVMGTLNLSQETSDKMQNESITLNRKYIENMVKNCYFGCLLWTEWTYWHHSFKILSGIFWNKFRVPTIGNVAPKSPYMLKNDTKRLTMAQNAQLLKILSWL